MSETTLFISPRGSVAHRCLFLPKGASAIILGVPGGSGEHFGEHFDSDAFLKYQSYVNILNYQVDIKDVVGFHTTPKEALADADVLLTREKLLQFARMAVTFMRRTPQGNANR